MDFQPMSPEEMQRAMQFLISQQAQFAADSARNETRLTEGFAHLTDGMGRLTDGLVRLTAVVGQLAAAQQRTDEQLRESDARLTKHIETVESHLNAMFDRHLREDHGHPPS